MKALILAGGFGKRLKPITDKLPKALVQLNEFPIIEWQIKYFKKFGIDEFVVCVGYKSNQIVKYIESKSNFGVKIDYSIEDKPLGTGGAIRKASNLLDENSFFVINGDVITNIDPRLLKSKSNTIAAIPLRSAFGIMNLNRNKIRGFEEKPLILDYWMNAGIYHLSNEIVNDLPKSGNIEKTVFPTYARKGKLSFVKYPKAFWYSIDSHKNIEECKKEMKSLHYKDFISRKC